MGATISFLEVIFQDIASSRSGGVRRSADQRRTVGLPGHFIGLATSQGLKGTLCLGN